MSNHNRLFWKPSAGAAAVIASTLIVGAFGGEKQPVETHDADPFCSLSQETKEVVIQRGEGIDSALLQIAGVTYGTCHDTALAAVVALNPGEHVTTPSTGQIVEIPVSAVFNEG